MGAPVTTFSVNKPLPAEGKSEETDWPGRDEADGEASNAATPS